MSTSKPLDKELGFTATTENLSSLTTKLTGRKQPLQLTDHLTSFRCSDLWGDEKNSEGDDYAWGDRLDVY